MYRNEQYCAPHAVLHVCVYVCAPPASPPPPWQDLAPLDLEIEDVKGRLSEWIAQEQVAAEIKRRFRHFLLNYPNRPQQRQGEEEGRQQDGARQPEVYIDKITAMCKGEHINDA